MSEWKTKRFWSATTVVPVDNGYTVQLDGRSVKTPAKELLVVPTEEMARAIAQEWDAQDEKIDPGTMPVTRSANAALDKVRQQKNEVADMIAAYGDSDLICYRATEPKELVERQAKAWDPMLDWAESVLSAPLQPVSGVMHSPQPSDALCSLKDKVHAQCAFKLTALHDLVSLSGSLIIGLAAIENQTDPETLWGLSRVDETWQEELWGKDDEATEHSERKKSAFLHAKRFFDLV